MAAPPVSFEDLDNSVRNGKKKLYWSAFEVVLSTAQPGGAAPLETRYDAYQVNHNHLKKLHAGARSGPHYVRVECKYCTAPRFTQSITVSTKKFEEHYMTLHALDALASADAKKAQQLQRSRHNGKTEDDDQDVDDENGATGDEAHAQRSKRGRKPAVGDGSAAIGGDLKRPRRGATARDDDAMQGAAAAVVALSGGASATRDTSDAAEMTQATSTTLPSSLVDSSILLDPADSDTKRAKKSYWTAYEVVICERMPPSDGGGGDDLEGAKGGETVVRETRQDAWRVNHNALRRLHLDADRDTTVRVECRFCDEPKFNQSITVSTRKFEQHYYYEHGDENQRQELEARLAAKAAESAAAAAGLQQGDTEKLASSLEAMPSIQPRRRKSWKALLLERENSMGSTTAVGKAPFQGGLPTGSNSRSRFQRALLLNWLVQETLPLSAVAGSDHFQAFVSSLDRKCEVPSLPSLRAQLQQRADAARASVKTAIQDELASAEAGATAFALTIDTFPVHTTSDQSDTAFVSVTVHYVSRDWERQQLLLACRAVPDAASDESVWAIVRDVLNEFGIPTDVVVSATVRDADAMGVASVALASGSKPTGRDPAGVVVLCAAGALHAVAEAGVDAIRRSTAEPLKTLLQQQEGLAAAHSWMDFSMALSTMEPTAVSTETLAIAHAVVALLEPFVRVAHELSTATAYPTMAMVFQYFRHLNESLAEIKHASKDALAPVIKVMQASLDGVFDKVVSTNALVAYVLDPRFRFANISSVDEKRIRARLTEEIAAITGGGDASTDNVSLDTRAGVPGDASTGSTSTTRQTRSLFEELATSGKRTSVGGSTTSATTNATPTPASGSVACSELVEYLALDDEEFSVNVLQWWQTHEAQFPTLSRVARQYLALVGTSLPPNELFTVAGQQRVVRRSGLDVEMLEATVLVRAHPEPVMEQIPLSQPARADTKRRKPMGSSPVAVASAPVPPGLTLEAAVAEASDKESVAIVV